MIPQEYISFGIALLLGAFIGTERQFAANQVDKYLGGIRTFSMISLGGAISAYIESKYIPNFFLLAFASFFLLIIVSYVFLTIKGNDSGVTTEFVSPIVFALGGLSWWQEYTLTISLTIIIMFVLSSKRMIQQLTAHFSYEDIRASTVLLVLTFIILPIVPNVGYGPFEAFNPYRIWLFIILVSSISFFAYIILKIFHQSIGTVVTGILGGIVSSTAATMALARRSKENSALSITYSNAAVVASAIMPVRAVILTFIVLPQYWIYTIPLALPGLLFGAWLSRRILRDQDTKLEPLQLSNPFRLNEAIQFGLILAIATFLSKAFKEWFGVNAIILITAVSGSLSVDAAVLSLGDIVNQSNMSSILPISVAMAIFTNCIVKSFLAHYLGSKEFGKVTSKWIMLIGITSLLPILIILFI